MTTSLSIKTVPAKNPRITIVIPSELKEKLEQLSKVRYQPMSAIALELIRQEIIKAEKEGEISSSEE